MNIVANLKRESKLRLRLWQMRGQAVLDRINRWWAKQHCIHSWRPAVAEINDAPFLKLKMLGKQCRYCDKWEQLTREEFYAEFGERYQAMLPKR